MRHSLAPSRRAASISDESIARVGVDPHQEDAERADRARQDDRQRAVGQVDLGEQQPRRHRQRLGRHHHASRGSARTSARASGRRTSRTRSPRRPRSAPRSPRSTPSTGTSCAARRGRCPPSSVRIANRSRTFWTRWKSSANHRPNVLKRSLRLLRRRDDQPEQREREVREERQHEELGGERATSSASAPYAGSHPLTPPLPRPLCQ